MAFLSLLRQVRGLRPGIALPVLTTALAVFGVAAMSAQGQAAAQAAPSPSVQDSAQSPAKSNMAGTHTAHPSKHGTHTQAAKPTPAVPVVVEATPPPAPPPPNWPANDKAVPPSVSWNGRDLTIAASNSSLEQILTEVSTATGVKVEGGESDQRIFGSYGPAPARDVLNQLLDGSGYNVLIIGDKGEGTPRELVLTAKVHGALPNPGANAQSRQSSEDEAPEEPEPPEQPNNGNPGNPNNPGPHRPFGMQPGQGRSPEQLQQEMQQRMQQLQQQQQQPQGQPPQNPQPPNQ